MDRRTFVARMGAASAALAVPAVARAESVQALEGTGTSFHFLAIAGNPAGTDMLAISGEGSANSGQAIGGGAWQHFDNDPALPVPKPVFGCGRWRTTRLDSLDLIGTWGCFAAGTIVMDARFAAESGVRFAATVTMNCNLGFAGLATGLPEGAFVEIPDLGLSFEPAAFPGGFPLGLTVFTVINESSGGLG